MTTTTTPDFVLEIIQQLGGIGKLRAMINARELCYTDNAQERSLQFRFSCCSTINKFKIILTPLDLYDLEFWKLQSTQAIMNGAQPQLVKRYDLVYGDQLIDLFETTTKLRLSL